MKSMIFTVPHIIVRRIFYIIGGVLMLAGVFMPAISVGQGFAASDFPYDTESTVPLIGDNEPTNL
jgi:hypothetical protein